VAQQHQRPGPLSPHVIEHLGQVHEQRIVAGNRTTRPARTTVAAVVVAGDMPAGRVQLAGQPGVAPGVFTQAVHQQHGAPRGSSIHGPLGQMQRRAVGSLDRRHGRRV
jgi:hypothetical protein